MADRKSDLAKQIEARKRTLHEFPAEKFTGLGGRIVGGIKVYAPLKNDEIQARIDADAWVKDTYKASSDEELRIDARTVFLLHRLCRDFEDPLNFPAFPTPAWMIAHLSDDELGCLLRCVAAVKAAESPVQKTMTDEEVDVFVERGAVVNGTENAHKLFVNCDRMWLEDYALVLSKRLADLTNPPAPEPDPELPEAA